MLWQGDGPLPDTAEPHSIPSPALPSTEDVIRKTEQITKNIQELLRAAQENKHDRYGLQLHSERVNPCRLAGPLVPLTAGWSLLV